MPQARPASKENTEKSRSSRPRLRLIRRATLAQTRQNPKRKKTPRNTLQKIPKKSPFRLRVSKKLTSQLVETSLKNNLIWIVLRTPAVLCFKITLKCSKCLALSTLKTALIFGVSPKLSRKNRIRSSYISKGGDPNMRLLFAKIQIKWLLLDLRREDILGNQKMPFENLRLISLTKNKLLKESRRLSRRGLSVSRVPMKSHNSSGESSTSTLTPS